MKKALLSITGAFNTDGGIATVNRLVIYTLAQSAYQIDIFALVETEPPEEIPLGAGECVKYHCFDGNKARFTAAIWQAVWGKNYDLIFTDHVNLASILAPMKILRRCQYVVWLHWVEIFTPKPDFEGRIGLRSARRCLASSEYTQKYVQERFPNLSVRSCDLALDPVRHPSNLPPELPKWSNKINLVAIDGTRQTLEAQVILNVGRMVSGDRDKGHETLLKSFAYIHERFPDSQLVLIGQGPDMERLLTITQSMPAAVQRNVFIPGYVNHETLDQLYQACYLFAMPSVGEGFGLTYLEAMSRGKPCVGGRVDATPYVVRDGETGLLVDDPRSPEQVAAKVIWLLEHPVETEEFGSAGYHLVRSYYLFPHFKERFRQSIKITR